MNITYVCEKRGNTYCAVMDLPNRKKGEGCSFYNSSSRNFTLQWCLENSSPQEETEGEE